MESEYFSEYPQVSVVIPLYNGERFIEETLESVLCQTYPHYEVLVVDNRSTDNGPNLVRDFIKKDDRFKLLQEEILGVAHARNYGICNARNEWIAILDHDDIWMPDKLELHLKFILNFERETGRKISGTGTYGIYIGEIGVEVGVLEPGCDTIESYEWKYKQGKIFYLLNSSVMMKKSVFLDVGGYNGNYSVAEDVEIYTRMAEKGVIINYPRHLFKYRVHDHSDSTIRFYIQQINTLRILYNIQMRRKNQPEKNYKEFKKLLESEPFTKKWLRKLSWSSQHKYRISGAALANRDYVKGYSYMILAALLNPFLVWRRLSRQVFPYFRRPEFKTLANKESDPRGVGIGLTSGRR